MADAITAVRRRRRTNKQLLIERLFTSFVERRQPEGIHKRETSHMQGIARHFADELTALSEGAGECKKHADLIEGACPVCAGIWSEEVAGG